MSEERKLILQMVSEGRISPSEAELLLQAVDESEQTARTTIAEEVKDKPRTREGFKALENLGPTIDRALAESMRGVDEALKRMESKFDNIDLRDKIQVRVLKATEREVERAARETHREAERVHRDAERAAREAAREAERALREAEREARDAEREAREAEREAARAAREAEREARRHEREVQAEKERELWDFDDQSGERFFKVGAVIDRVNINKVLNFAEAIQPGETLSIKNKVGQVSLEQYDGTEVQVIATMNVWGEDEADAGDRAEATKVMLTRRGSELYLHALRPTIVGVGFINIKRTAIDYHVRLPKGVNLFVANKVGDVHVAGAPDAGWKLHSKVGDVQVVAPVGAAFQYDTYSKLGTVWVQMTGTKQESGRVAGSVGEGGGSLVMSTKHGDIRLVQQ